MPARLFPPLLLMGMMILITSIIMAHNCYGCWNHYIPLELNLVAAGDQWLGYLLTSDTVNTWLAPFRSVEVAPVEPASPWP